MRWHRVKSTKFWCTIPWSDRLIMIGRAILDNGIFDCCNLSEYIIKRIQLSYRIICYLCPLRFLVIFLTLSAVLLDTTHVLFKWLGISLNVDTLLCTAGVDTRIVCLHRVTRTTGCTPESCRCPRTKTANQFLEFLFVCCGLMQCPVFHKTIS